MKLKVNFIIIFVAFIINSCGNRNYIELNDDVATIEHAIFSVDSIYSKFEDSVSLVFVMDNQLYINRTNYDNFDSLTQEKVPELDHLDGSDWQLLKDNLALLQRNNINGFSSTRYGFTRFIYKDEPGEAYMNRYIALDSGNLSLDHTGYKLLDRKSNLVLFSGR
ncbi:hypothetical protein I2I11_13850 [Pontibacter sp. 172403-2]|uniref:hypothetical protein n=1 Tax=Pontibacter rufus TaxID=2791028 RepID=UPI0018AFAF39|nr:hypothetical protein [Pontibacter sp. 172403-2]MBF9254384.1 hypothetical protein [Pontibacter sp. 172403-2]